MPNKILDVSETFSWENPPSDHNYSVVYIINVVDDRKVYWLAGYEPDRNYISPAGGSSDRGENAVETAIRESYEETCAQVFFSLDEFQDRCFGILKKVNDEGRYQGYIFFIEVQDWDMNQLNLDVQQAYSKEVRDVYKEVSEIVPVLWKTLMQSEDVRVLRNALNGKTYFLRDKAIPEIRYLQKIYANLY